MPVTLYSDMCKTNVYSFSILSAQLAVPFTLDVLKRDVFFDQLYLCFLFHSCIGAIWAPKCDDYMILNSLSHITTAYLFRLENAVGPANIRGTIFNLQRGKVSSNKKWASGRCHGLFFLFIYFFFSFPSYISGVHHFWVRFLRMWPFFNPTIKVVTFRHRGWCVLGVFLLPAFTRLGHERQDLLSPCDEIYVCTD